MNYLPTALKGSTRSWMMHLPPSSISSWADLWQQFVANFQGTYKRHAIDRRAAGRTQSEWRADGEISSRMTIWGLYCVCVGAVARR
ncbi:hypothetical protein, partial [Klebsiella pneumoniae]|uniref:hypothetical protein n=1 Tax=Klebsiella pneumoniae TaxID=573 RepID=UPI003B595A49